MNYTLKKFVKWSEHVSPHAGKILWKNQALMDYDSGVGFSLPYYKSLITEFQAAVYETLYYRSGNLRSHPYTTQLILMTRSQMSKPVTTSKMWQGD